MTESNGPPAPQHGRLRALHRRLPFTIGTGYGEGDFFVRHQYGDTGQLEFDHLRVRKASEVIFLN
jgi:hypothetical protein